MSDAVQWPPSSGLTSKIVPRKDVVLQISYASTIRAPASVVFDVILHVADYPEWNTWVPSARILTQPMSSEPDCNPNDFSHMRIGSIMNFDVVMDSEKPNKIWPTPLKVVDICTPTSPTSYLSPELLEDATFTSELSRVYRVSWTGHGGASSFGLKLERFHEVIITGESQCEVRTWEVMGGVLARVVKLMYQDTLEKKVELWCEDLKKRCEDKSAAQTMV